MSAPPVPSLLSNLGWLAALLAAAAIGALDAYVAYEAGPLVAALLPVAALVAVVVVWRPIAGACLAVLAIPLDSFAVEVGAVALSPTELLLAATAGGVLARMATGADLWPVPALHATGAIAVVAMLGGLLVAPDGTAVLKGAVMWALFLIAALWVARSTPEEIRALMLCLVFVGGVLGALAVLSGDVQRLTGGGTNATGRATAVFVHPNLLAAVLALAIPPGVVLALSSRGVYRAIAVPATLLAVAGLVLTLSRSSIVGTLVALVFLMVMWPAFRRLVAVLIVAGAVLVAANFEAISQSRQVSVVSERLGTLTDSRERGSDPRFEIWAGALQMFSDEPLLGVGRGNFPEVAPRYGLVDTAELPYQHGHSLPLTVLAEGGLVGGLAVLLFLWALGRQVLHALRARAAPWWPLALGCAGAVIGLGVVCLTDFPLTTNVVAGPALLLAAALVALAREPVPDGAPA